MLDSGVEIFSFDTEYIHNGFDPQIYAGMITAIKSISKETGNAIESLRFADGSVLYVRTFSNFDMRMLFKEEVSRDTLEHYFNELYRRCWSIIEDKYELYHKDDEEIYDAVKPFLVNIVGETRRMNVDIDYFDLSVKQRTQMREYEILKQKLENQDKYGRLK